MVSVRAGRGCQGHMKFLRLFQMSSICQHSYLDSVITIAVHSLLIFAWVLSSQLVSSQLENHIQLRI